MKKTKAKHDGAIWRCLNRLVSRHFPHKTRSGNQWCKPMLWAKVFGGTWDTGNGYAWSPKIWRRECFRVGRFYLSKSIPPFREKYGYRRVFRIGKWSIKSVKANSPVLTPQSGRE